MLNAILLLLLGWGCGICSSAPLGPINLWIVDRIITKETHRIPSFITGVILVDSLFATTAMLGMAFLVPGPDLMMVIKLLGGFFLIGFGYISLTMLKNNNPKVQSIKNSETIKQSLFSDALIGISLCGVNPAFLMFWIFVVGWIQTSLEIPLDNLTRGFFVLGVILGDGMWFKVLQKLATKSISQAGPTIINGLRYCIALGFISFGAIALIRLGWERFGV